MSSGPVFHRWVGGRTLTDAECEKLDWQAIGFYAGVIDRQRERPYRIAKPGTPAYILDAYKRGWERR